jgi:hypothetical protein
MPPVSAPARPHDTARGGLPPVKTFFALLLVVAVVTGLALLQEEAPLTSAPALNQASPDIAEQPKDKHKDIHTGMSSQKAVSLFHDLRTRLNSAIRRRDLAAIASVLHGGSPISRRAKSVVRQLLSDDVLDKTRVRTVRTALTFKDSNTMRFEEVAILHPCFVTEGGRDVTKGPEAVRQTGIWTLERRHPRWRITQGRLTRDRIVEAPNARCP